MSFGWRGDRGSVLKGTLAVVVLLALPGCSRSVQPPAQDVVAAMPGQFAEGLAVSVTAGSTGQEGSPTDVQKSWWWLSTAQATVTATNNGPAAPHATLSATLAAPPCVKQASLKIKVGNGQTKNVLAAKAGTPLSVPVDIGSKAQLEIQISVSTPPCRVSGDSRTLYLQLIGLTLRG